MIRKPFEYTITIEYLQAHMEDLNRRGFRPYIKGKGEGSIKIEFEEIE